MNILEYITNLLQETGLDAFYIMKPMGYPSDDYLTFNFIIRDTWYSDNTNEMNKYYVTINHLTKKQKNVYYELICNKYSRITEQRRNPSSIHLEILYKS